MAIGRLRYKLPDMGNDWLHSVPLYIIISPQNSTASKIMFWKALDSGYTEHILCAGLYTATQVLASPEYYNDGMCGVAVPLTGTAMRKLGIKVSIDIGALKAFANRAVDATKQL